MDVKLNSEQTELLRSVKGALERHRSSRAAPGPSDADLAAAAVLESAGYLDVLSAGGTACDALLVVEQAAASAPGSPVGARAYVAPLVTDRALPLCVGLIERPTGGIVRFGAEASAFLVLDAGAATYALASEVDVEPLTSRWGYPVARVTVRGGERLGKGSGERLRRAWQTAVAAELAGLMEAAIRHAADYVSQRQQFGRAIGSLQSIQHRLAHAHVKSQGAKWLARYAAWDPGNALAAATAACYATEAVREVMSTAQQVCGAIGITDEFGLTRYTARMARLQTELGGPISLARDVARTRWATHPGATRGASSPGVAATAAR